MAETAAMPPKQKQHLASTDSRAAASAKVTTEKRQQQLTKSVFH
jgi:hypothetical protein